MSCKNVGQVVEPAWRSWLAPSPPGAATARRSRSGKPRRSTGLPVWFIWPTARSASQLVSGFYDIEQNSWRWTARQFSVLLRPPRNAVQKGGVLKLKFSVPGPVLAKLKALSLSASLGGLDLSPETYTQAGEFTYSRDVSGAVLAGDAVKVDFSLDKALPPDAVDQRELGVIVSNVGLEPK